MCSSDLTTPTRYNVYKHLELAVFIYRLTIHSVPFPLPTHVVPGGHHPIP